MKYKFLALFDIDSTLVRGSKIHWDSFSFAFKKVYSVDTSIEIINSHGMTDQQIIIAVLKKKGLTERKIKSKLKECMRVMASFFKKTIEGEKITVLPGVENLLKELKKRKVLMGLVTGNLEPIARGKLKNAHLNQYFKIGGFGSDDIDRTKLVKLAIKRARKYGFKFNNNVYLFGDTPHDIKAAKSAGVKAIGVTTGIYSEKDLNIAGADFVLKDLKNTNRVLKILST